MFFKISTFVFRKKCIMVWKDMRTNDRMNNEYRLKFIVQKTEIFLKQPARLCVTINIIQ